MHTKAWYSTALLLAAFILITAAAGATDIEPRLTEPAVSTNLRTGSSVQLGNDIVVPAGTSYSGDAVAIFGNVVVDGEVQGNAVAVGGSTEINGKVMGDVVAVGGSVSLASASQVQGSVTSVGGGISGSRANVAGEVSEVSFGPGLRNIDFWPNDRWYKGFSNPLWHLFLMAGWFSVALITMSIFPQSTKNVATAIEKSLPRSILIGLAATFLLLPATIVLAITVVGILGIPLLWLGLLLAKVLGYTGLVFLVGHKIGGMAEGHRNPIITLAIGVGIIGLIGFVPVLNFLLSVFAGLVTIGAALDTKFGTNRPWLPPKQKPDGPNPA